MIPAASEVRARPRAEESASLTVQFPLCSGEVVAFDGLTWRAGESHGLKTQSNHQHARAISPAGPARSVPRPDPAAYPFCLPFLRHEFEVSFDRPITIIAGENGAGKSTLLEGIAVLAGYDEAGGGKGHRPVDHSTRSRRWAGSFRRRCAQLAPKVTNGWFFRAESFFSVARYLDSVGSSADFLSHSHGEGFMRFFQERCQRQGIYIFDEPEAALSPARQMEFLKLMRRMEDSTICQVVMATHSPMLMAYPGARLLQMSKYGLEP